MKGGVENSHLRYSRHDFFQHLDPRQIGLVMEGAPAGRFADGLLGFFGDQGGLGKVRPSVDDPVTDRCNLVKGGDYPALAVKQGLQKDMNRILVRFHLPWLVYGTAPVFIVKKRLINADPLAKPLGQHLLLFAVDELKLE